MVGAYLREAYSWGGFIQGFAVVHSRKQIKFFTILLNQLCGKILLTAHFQNKKLVYKKHIIFLEQSTRVS